MTFMDSPWSTKACSNYIHKRATNENFLLLMRYLSHPQPSPVQCIGGMEVGRMRYTYDCGTYLPTTQLAPRRGSLGTRLRTYLPTLTPTQCR